MEILVKVGLRSDIKMRGAKCYRAITFKEVSRLLNKFTGISYIILEDMGVDDVDEIRSRLGKYLDKVIVYNRFDESTQEVKDTLKIEEIRYAVTLEELSRIVNGGIESVSDTSNSTLVEEQAFEYDSSDYEDTTEAEEEIPTESKSVVFIRNKSDIEEIEYEEVALSESNIDFKGIIEEKDNIITSLNLVNKSLENDLFRYKERIKEIDNDTEIEIVESERKRLALANEKVAKIQGELDEANSRIAELNSISSEIEHIKISLYESETELAQKNELIASLEEEIAVANDKSAEEELKDKLLAGMREKAELESRVDILTADIERLNNVINEKDKNIDKIQGVYEEVKGELEVERDKYKSIENELSSQMSANEGVKAEYSSKITQLNIQLESLQSKHRASVAKYKEQLNDADTRIRDLEKDNTDIMAKCDERISKLNRIITENSAKIKGIEKETEVKYSNIISDLNMEIELCKRQKDAEIQQREKIENTVKDLLREKVRLREDLAKFRKAGMAVSNVVNTRDIDYKSNAKIIMVYGSGSYGVTSMAYAIAKSKNFKGKRVLFMDLDCVNPKADVLLGVSPILPNITGIQEKLKCTSFGVLLEQGTDRVLQGGRGMLKNVSNIKSGATIDYFSGCYTGVNAEEMNSVNFDKLFTTYGKIYDYIVIDAGKIGNELSNSLILRIGKIASHKLIVTLNTPEDVRGMSIKLLKLGVSRENTRWILNLSPSEKIDDTTRNNIGNMEYKILPMDAQIYGKSLSLDRSAIIRDRVLDITDSIK